MTRVLRTFCFSAVLIAFGFNVSAALPDKSRQLVGHGGPVNAISVSPDGRRAISGSLDYSVIFWDIENPNPAIINRVNVHRGAVSEVRFLPSGKKAVSAGDDGHIYFWDVDTQQLIHKLKGHRGKVVNTSFTPDARLMSSAGWDGTVRIWDLSSMSMIREIPVHNNTLHSTLLSDDGQFVYSAGYDGHIRQWNIRTGQMIKVLHNHGWPINLMQWVHGHQQIVFGTSNGDVQVMDVDTGKISKILIPHSKPVLGLDVSEQHHLLVTGGNDGVIRAWDTTEWSLIGQTEGIPGPVWALSISDNGQGVYFGTLDDNSLYWQIDENDDTQWRDDFKQHRFKTSSEGKSVGEVQFLRKCSVCHTLSPENRHRAGPSLYRLTGRKAGTLPGYAYSLALKKSDVVWDRDSVERLFLDGPDKVVPGSKMPLQRIPNNKQRSALIDYLMAQ